MGHLIFIVLHVGCVLFATPLLIITIPLHLIYAAVATKRPAPGAPTVWTHVRCPDCQELVPNEARVCSHCGCKLIPVSEQPKQSGADRILSRPRGTGAKHPS